MTEATLKLDIPIVLPEVENERDQCIERLQELVLNHRGITKAHVERENGDAKFCVHYDPNLVPLNTVRRLAMDAGAKVTQRYEHEMLQINGMDCADCASSIEHIVGRIPGILNVMVNYPTGKLRVEYDTQQISRKKIVQRLDNMGYPVVKPEEEHGWLAHNRELMLAILSGLLLALGFIGEQVLGLPPYITIGLYILAYLAGGFNTARHGIEAALHLRFDVDFLMVVAAIGAAFLGEWAEGALLLFLFSLGHALEHSAMDRARNAIAALGEITPKTARVSRDGRELEVPIEELAVGDHVIVRSGERIPVDGSIIEGRSAVDQASVTGESVPVEKDKGDSVLAGTVNGEGALEVEVRKLAQDTTLARVIQMVEEAQTQQSPTQRFTERFTRIFVPAVLVTVAALSIVPPLIGWLTWQAAFLRGMTLLVAASPCALALSTPSAVLAGIAQAARHGVLIKGGVHLENLGRVEAIALDKTGTITYGKPEVTDVLPLGGLSEDDLLRLTAAVESRSNHPLALAIIRHIDTRQLDYPQAADLQSITGRGVQAQVNGQLVEIGSQRLFNAEGQIIPAEVAEQIARLETEGKTTMLIRQSGQYVGIIALADQPRATAAATLAQLRQMGIKALVMLTGDNARVAETLAKQVGMTDQRAELMPEDKVAAIKQLADQYGSIAMVGDGVNDAPALANATVGIAMGAGGSDVALETADIALMGDDPAKVPFAVGLSRQSRRIIQQNLVISLGVVAVLVIASITGIASIGPAIVFHEGSTLLVVFNALRLLSYKPA